jgi:hypothetical protein
VFAGQQPFEGVAQIAQQMPAIGDLPRLGCAPARGVAYADVWIEDDVRRRGDFRLLFRRRTLDASSGGAEVAAESTPFGQGCRPTQQVRIGETSADRRAAGHDPIGVQRLDDLLDFSLLAEDPLRGPGRAVRSAACRNARAQGGKTVD